MGDVGNFVNLILNDRGRCQLVNLLKYSLIIPGLARIFLPLSTHLLSVIMGDVGNY